MTLPINTPGYLHHRGKERIGLYFGYNRGPVLHTKQLKGATWSATNNRWHVENNPDKLRKHDIIFHAIV